VFASYKVLAWISKTFVHIFGFFFFNNNLLIFQCALQCNNIFCVYYECFRNSLKAMFSLNLIWTSFLEILVVFEKFNIQSCFSNCDNIWLNGLFYFIFIWKKSQFNISLCNLGWKHSQRSYGCQGKSLFLRITHDTCHFFLSIYNFKFFILSIPFNIEFKI